MSEPTGDGKQNFDPDKDQVVQDQDQTSGSDFSDPTAPVWADPATPQVPAPPAPPMSNPYAQQSAPQPSPWSPQPTDPYGQPQPSQQYPAYSQQYYATGAPTVPSNTSAIILTILSGVSMLSTVFFVGLPSLIFGIMALTSNNTDPVGSRKKARNGWIIYAINVGLILFAVVAIFAIVFIARDSGSTSDSGY